MPTTLFQLYFRAGGPQLMLTKANYARVSSESQATIPEVHRIMGRHALTVLGLPRLLPT